jgi:hypothetical protein
MILTTVAFWVVRIDTVVELFEGVYQAGRWPVTVYPGWLRVGLTFLVPIAFAVTVPAEGVTSRLSAPTLLGAAALAALLFAAALCGGRVPATTRAPRPDRRRSDGSPPRARGAASPGRGGGLDLAPTARRGRRTAGWCRRGSGTG